MHNQRKHPQNDLPNRQLQTPDTTTTPNHLTGQHPHNPLQHNIGMAKILSQQKTVLYIMQIHQNPWYGLSRQALLVLLQAFVTL